MAIPIFRELHDSLRGGPELAGPRQNVGLVRTRSVGNATRITELLYARYIIDRGRHGPRLSAYLIIVS